MYRDSNGFFGMENGKKRCQQLMIGMSSATRSRSSLHLSFWSMQNKKLGKLLIKRRQRIQIASHARNVGIKRTSHVTALVVPRHRAKVRTSVPRRRLRIASLGLRRRNPELNLVAARSGFQIYVTAEAFSLVAELGSYLPPHNFRQYLFATCTPTCESQQLGLVIDGALKEHEDNFSAR